MFRFPGQQWMYTFDEIRAMKLSKGKPLEVIERKRANQKQSLGNMSVSAILSKFG